MIYTFSGVKKKKKQNEVETTVRNENNNYAIVNARLKF